jgi:type III pantothenate kinase
MSTLLVDIGNTRVKWARLVRGKVGRQHAAAHLNWTEKDFERRVLAGNPRPSRILVSSVAGERVNRLFRRAARAATGVSPEFLATPRSAAGVTTMYSEPWRLGVDRFVSSVGARHLARGRAVCAVNIGTAMTLDLVDEQGRHRGGAIIPGPQLMVLSLLANTDGILRRARGTASGRSFFARNTRGALEQGARYAAAAVIDRAVSEAKQLLGKAPLVLVAGGAARHIGPLLRSRHRVVPDLVLRGLAVLAGQQSGGARTR